MRRPASPTIDLLVAFVAVFAVESVGGLVGVGPAWFALADPIARPWTLVTSVYAHAGLAHLLANGIALALVGFVLERSTTRLRFHAFFLATGALAGLSEVVASGALGRPTAVIGASGAVLALVGYVVTANPVAGAVLGRLDVGRRARLFAFVGAAVLVTAATATAGVALVAHFTGFLLGLLSGRVGLLSTGPQT